LKGRYSASDHRRRVAPIEAEIPAAVSAEGFGGDRIELPDDRRVGQTVLEDVLPVANRGDLVCPCIGARRRHDIVKIAVAHGRRAEQHVQLEILSKLEWLFRRRRPRIELPIRVHQKRLHGRTLARRRW
jgi:hypothetical protein